MMPPPRRKKWTEAEERTLIDKYGEMVCDGSLPKMKTREKKYKPIALYVNSVHHASDPITYPWQWTWKDVSTKVQNMRHQYSLVKQKIKTTQNSEDFEWLEGITHWSNFLRYKEVFGDVALVCNSNDGMAIGNNNENGEGFDGSNHRMEIVQFGHFSQEGDGDFAAAVEDGVMGLEFGYDGEEGEENYNNDDDNNNNNHNNSNNNHMKEDGDNNGFVYQDIEPVGSDTRKKRKVLKGLEKRAWGFVANQLRQLREMETRFEQRELERERERQRRENLRMENEHECDKRWEKREKEREEREKAKEQLKRQRLREWEALEKESEVRETTRREEELLYEREWEERMNQRRCEWKKRIDEMLTQHRVEVGQIQTRILHEQQNLTSQLLGIFPQWTGHPTGIPDHTGASNHYLSQMLQNLHHENGIVHEDTRVEGDNQDDQFIVDG